jgi:hypothetical protein
MEVMVLRLCFNKVSPGEIIEMSYGELGYWEDIYKQLEKIQKKVTNEILGD